MHAKYKAKCIVCGQSVRAHEIFTDRPNKHKAQCGGWCAGSQPWSRRVRQSRLVTFNGPRVVRITTGNHTGGKSCLACEERRRTKLMRRAMAKRVEPELAPQNEVEVEVEEETVKKELRAEPYYRRGYRSVHRAA